MPTGRHFHVYLDPERPMDADAERVHGLSDAFLAGRARFADAEVLPPLVEFLGEADLVAHNASFDRAFLEHEFARAGHRGLHGRTWIDTLALAQSRFPVSPTHSTPCAGAITCPWPNGKSTGRSSTRACWRRSISSCAAGASGRWTCGSSAP